MGNFVDEQKGINMQLAQRIDTVENTMNKKIDGLESNLNQKMDNLQYSITKINKLLRYKREGGFHHKHFKILRGFMRWGREWMRLSP